MTKLFSGISFAAGSFIVALFALQGCAAAPETGNDQQASTEAPSQAPSEEAASADEGVASSESAVLGCSPTKPNGTKCSMACECQVGISYNGKCGKANNGQGCTFDQQCWSGFCFGAYSGRSGSVCDGGGRRKPGAVCWSGHDCVSGLCWSGRCR